mmetsp:Transcript_146520/g.255631  ORF Transcript_146520/g.255631 Transcript_146520/m.255631 type:complete len:82 (+) Transcript_146520:12-257(+)
MQTMEMGPSCPIAFNRIFSLVYFTRKLHAQMRKRVPTCSGYGNLVELIRVVSSHRYTRMMESDASEQLVCNDGCVPQGHRT